MKKVKSLPSGSLTLRSASNQISPRLLNGQPRQSVFLKTRWLLPLLNPPGRLLLRAVPGVLIRGTLNDDHQGRFLLRLPKEWNGKLVVAGAAGTRSEFNGDLVISDYVLQKGYAYASQNKGTMNFKPADNSNLNVSCPLHPVADAVAGSDANPLLYFALLDDENSLMEWGERINQAALIAKALIEAHYGRKPSRTYAMGVSNGGYQVRKAIEDHPETFDGGVEWEAVLWQRNGPNFIGRVTGWPETVPLVPG